MRPPERTRIRVSPGAPALLAVFVWLSSPEVLGAVLLAALCHELGHYAALRRRGGWVRAVRISALGAEMQVASVNDGPVTILFDTDKNGAGRA